MWSEDDLIPLSALQHYRFCPRQCALIHLERLWIDNRLTAEGTQLHEKVDGGASSDEAGVRIRRSLPLRSFKLGVSGIADVVEFRKSENGQSIPYPVEYKRGKPKKNDCDAVQLCAQAICLEEMLGTKIDEGAFFYWKTRHRHPVFFDSILREKTFKVAADLHEMFASGQTPRPKKTPACKNCSFFDYCKPDCFEKPNTDRHLKNMMEEK